MFKSQKAIDLIGSAFSQNVSVQGLCWNQLYSKGKKNENIGL